MPFAATPQSNSGGGREVDQRTVIYYQDELHDEFSTAVIEAKTIDESYIYDRRGPIRAFTRFF